MLARARLVWTANAAVPVEHIADSCFGLHVSDVGTFRRRRVCLAGGGPVASGLLLPGVGDLGTAAEAATGRRSALPRSATRGPMCLPVRAERSGVAPTVTGEGATPRPAAPTRPRERGNEFAAAM